MASTLIPANSNRPGDDPIFALHGEAMRRKAAGEDVLNATLGALMEDDGRPAIMPSVTTAFARVPAESWSLYAPISGPARFLRAVEKDLFGDDEELLGRAVSAATAGGTGACHHGIVNFIDVGEALITTSYYWGPYRILADHTRRGLITYETFRSDGTFDLDAFEAGHEACANEQGRVLSILNTPCHNPTGYSLDGDEWRRITDVLLRISERVPTTLLIDLAYAKFGAPGARQWREAAKRLSEQTTVLVAWSASKAFAQYGSRVGALVALHPDADERTRIGNALGYSCRGTWSNCNHLGMLAISELLEDDELRASAESDRDRLRALLGERVNAFNELAQAAGLSYPRYEGGFFVTVFTPDAERTATAMRERGVFVVPMGSAVRIGLCATPCAAIPRLVDALVEGVRAAGGQTVA